MSDQPGAEIKTDVKGRLLARLRDPVQLRICLAVVVLLVGYFAVYSPMSGEVKETEKKTAKEQKLVELAVHVERLRAQYKTFKDRLPQTDGKEWVKYVLDGLGKFPLRLVSLTNEAPRELGAYKAVVLRAELEGPFKEMDGFLRWLESNQRMIRLDSVRFAPSKRDRQILVLQVTILGMMG